VLRESDYYDEKELEVVWRITKSRLDQDGYYSQEDDDGDDYPTTTTNTANINHGVISNESGIRYRNFPYSVGHKIVFYCDQRENRLSLVPLCR